MAASAGYTRVPITREIVLDADTPVSVYSKLHRGTFGFLLESLEGGERWARYSFVATEPRTVYRYRSSTVEQWDQNGWTRADAACAPLQHLAEILREDRTAPVDGLPRFTGGAVGFWGYDVVRGIESLPSPPPDDRDLPDALVMMVDTLLVFDHLLHRGIIVSNVAVTSDIDDATLDARISGAEAACAEWVQRLHAVTTLTPLMNPATLLPPLTSPYDAAQFTNDVLRCQEYIAAGDAFQVVLSRRTDLSPAPDPFLTYRWLRTLNPAPYCYHVALGELVLVGASPEVLVRVERGEVTVRPLAGTRPRGATPALDAALASELLADPKERAEHLMLVDLGRNDVGRVAAYGSVRVVEQMVVERYSQVMHIVSEVRGMLREGLDAFHALAAAFPAGTVSGAPKVRAMQIIDELEPTRRGPYAGAVGYIGYGAQTLDTAIAIRTIVFSGGSAFVQAGAGIVADSVPELEFRETENKAAAALRALAAALGANAEPGATDMTR